MKARFLLLMVLISHIGSAQVTINSGLQFTLTGNIQLTLRNTDFINNGNFTAGNSRISFIGNTSSAISGTQLIQFSEIEINKTNNSEVRLQRTIGVNNRVLFTSGFLNLNGFNTDLGNSGHLEGEQEQTRTVGLNGGEVLFNVNLNSPTNSNPANLGILITSNQNLGNVVIRRGHQSQQTSPSTGSSLLRYYDISPANNGNLNATIRFKYFEGELNGFDENTLTFFKSKDAIIWSALGMTSRDTTADFVEKINVDSFSRFTLSSPGNSQLPVNFILFNARCDENKMLLSWKTAQERNSNHFDIEKSIDAIHWVTIGKMPAAGNSSLEKTYSFTDNNPTQTNYYRIAQYDQDGKIKYTGILRSSCSTTDLFAIWPNPFQDLLFVNIVSNYESTAVIKLFDNKGALVRVQKAFLMRGSNQLRVDIGALPNGAYSLYAEWNNGQMKKAVQLLKQ